MFTTAKSRRLSIGKTDEFNTHRPSVDYTSSLQLAESDGSADEFNTHRRPLDLGPIDRKVGFTRAIYTPLSDLATRRRRTGIVKVASLFNSKSFSGLFVKQCRGIERWSWGDVR
jgi:hypothetical protein